MSVFGSINVVISAAIGGLAGDLGRALKALGAFGKSVLSALNPVKLLGSVLRSTFGQLALFSGANAIVSSLKQMAGAASENIDTMSKMSRRLGVTYGELAGIEHAGALAGVGIDQIGTAMTKADVMMQKAAGGSKQAQAAFAKLGLNVAQLQGMSAADRFEAISSALANIPNEAERSAAAVALFGRSGAELLPLFEGGANSIRDARAEAERLGLALTDRQAQSVEGMNDAFTRAYRAISGVVTQVVANLAPAVEALTTSFVDMIGSVGGANIGQTIADALMQGAIFLADTVDWLVPYMMSVWDGLKYVAGLLQVPFDLGYRTGQLFLGVGKILQAVFTSFVSAIVFVSKTLVGAAARIAENIPGMGSVASDLRSWEKGLQKTENSLTASRDQAAKESAAAFANAWNGSKNDAAAQIPGQFGTMMRDAATKMAENRTQIEQKAGQPTGAGGAGTVAAQVNSAELKAVLAGSSAGESFRNSLIRGADPRAAAEKAAEETAENTGEMVDQLSELNDSLSEGMGVATIAV